MLLLPCLLLVSPPLTAFTIPCRQQRTAPYVRARGCGRKGVGHFGGGGVGQPCSALFRSVPSAACRGSLPVPKQAVLCQWLASLRQPHTHRGILGRRPPGRGTFGLSRVLSGQKGPRTQRRREERGARDIGMAIYLTALIMAFEGEFIHPCTNTFDFE